MSESVYTPLIKAKGFCPNPVAQKGIPIFANTVRNPKALGTVAHQDWWDEQISYCMNGYYTGGVFLPGRYYYYLNFCYINTVERGAHLPEYVDLDLEFFKLVDEVKKPTVGKGIIIIKPRRKGISEKVTKGIADWGLRFKPEGYRAGICSGVDKYTEQFYTRLKKMNGSLPPELRMHIHTKNEETFMMGYTEKTEFGMIDGGSLNSLLPRVCDKKPNVFKGEFLNDCIFEEAGEFPALKLTYGATEACFKSGMRMIGTPYVYGTGGNIKSSSRVLSEMFHDHESYNLVPFEFYGDRLMVGFWIGSRNTKGEIEENCPNIEAMITEQGLSREQVLGCEDLPTAEIAIKAEALRLSQGKDRQKYYDYLTDYPLTRRELFLKFSANNFDTDALNDQRKILDEAAVPKFQRYMLEYVTDENQKIIIPLKVVAKLAGPDKKDDECIWIRYHPQPDFENLDVAGCDSYDQDKSNTTTSLGGFLILRRRGHGHKDENGMPTKHKRIPVLAIRQRPARKEIFYDNCMKAAIYYNLVRNVMIDASKPAVAKHFKDFGYEHMLSPRPQSFESATSEQQHEYGMMITTSPKSKTQMLGMMQSWVLDEVDECVFPVLIDELMDYDIEQKESDWDLADALGLALVRDADMLVAPSPKDDKAYEKAFELDDWKPDADGVLMPVSQHHLNEKIKDPFIRMYEAGAFGNNQQQRVDDDLQVPDDW